MKKGKLHRRKITAVGRLWLLIGCLSVFSACIQETIDYPAEEGEPQLVTLSIQVPGMDKATRALTETDETRIDNIYVLLFNSSGGTYVSKHLVDPVTIQDGETQYIKIFQVILPGGNYDLMVIANAQLNIEATTLTPGMTRTQVENALIEELEQAWPSASATARPFPMYGELPVTINNATTQTGTIYLVRALVRIDVIIDDNEADNLISSIRLYNRYKKAQIIPHYGNVSIGSGGTSFNIFDPSIPTGATKTRGPLLYTPQTPAKSVVASIYTFEALRGSFAGWEDNTCLVLGIGNVREDGAARSIRPDTYTWYYRVDFLNSQKPHDDTDYLPLLRNHIYEVHVQEIIHKGFVEPEEAFRSESYNLTYGVTAYEHVYVPEAQAGTHRLYISNTNPRIPVGTSADLSIYTTYPDGWSYKISTSATNKDEGDPFWLDVTLDSAPVQYNNVKVTLKPGSTGTVYIHVTAGNLTNVIKVYAHIPEA